MRILVDYETTLIIFCLSERIPKIPHKNATRVSPNDAAVQISIIDTIQLTGFELETPISLVFVNPLSICRLSIIIKQNG